MRLDKWLWAARFFKTRSLAADAVKGGKVEVNAHKAKPARPVLVHDEISIRRGPYEYTVMVLALASHRRPAAEAARLYHESEQSVQRRAALALELKAQAASGPRLAERPNKRDRRQIIRFTRKRDA